MISLLPDTTDDLLRQALKALRAALDDARKRRDVADELLASVKELRAALEDGRKQRRQADELLTNMRDRLKSTIEGNRSASRVLVSSLRSRKAV